MEIQIIEAAKEKLAGFFRTTRPTIRMKFHFRLDDGKVVNLMGRVSTNVWRRAELYDSLLDIVAAGDLHIGWNVHGSYYHADVDLVEFAVHRYMRQRRRRVARKSVKRKQ